MRLPALLQRLRVSPPVNTLRYTAYKDVLLAYPRRHACNLCGWEGRRFLTYVHRHVLCPQCGSQVRHRLIGAALARRDDIRAQVRIEGRILHFSPEYCLQLVFRPGAAEYVRADYATADCDIRVDITRLAGVPDQRFDVVVACDVLEHVEDDRAALREIRRVLRPGGTAILTVPQLDGDVPTFEDASIRSPGARAAAFGQPDHVRNYGSDFTRRIEAAGFTVTVVDAASFDDPFVRRHVLRPPAPLAAAYGWNERRVHFARAAV